MWGTDLASTMTGEAKPRSSSRSTTPRPSAWAFTPPGQPSASRCSSPLRQSVRTCSGAFAEGNASGLRLRHDHGSQFIADDFQREVAFLGIESSPVLVREPEGCVERFIRTLKGNLLWVRRFDTIEDLSLACTR
jgi:transposase InsO family protein